MADPAQGAEHSNGERALRWDETNLSTNAAESLAANRQRIDEPKTPFHYLDEDGEHPENSERNPPRAAPARAAGRASDNDRQLTPGMGSIENLAALTETALERRENCEQPMSGDEDDLTPEEKRRKFEQNRKAHYRMGAGPAGGLAALRAHAQAAMEEEEEEENEKE